MKGKKADLLNNVLTTIIAVIGLVLLAYAALRLYSVYANQDEESAKKNLNFISDRIGDIDAGQNVIITIKGVGGWFLTGWQKDDISRPDKCTFYSCICICKGDIYGTELNGKLVLAEGVLNAAYAPELCQKTGFCREIKEDKLVILGSRLPYSKQESINPSYPNSLAPGARIITMTSTFPAIKFANNTLYEINASKEKGADGKITLKLELTS